MKGGGGEGFYMEDFKPGVRGREEFPLKKILLILLPQAILILSITATGKYASILGKPCSCTVQLLLLYIVPCFFLSPN